MIVSMSFGSPVEFSVRRRGKENAPSLVQLGHGDLLVMDGSAPEEYERSTSSELQRPGSAYSYRRLTQHTPTCHHVCKICPGWVPDGEGRAFSMPPFGVVSPLAGGRPRASHWRAPRLLTRCGLASVAATLVRCVSPKGRARWIGRRQWAMPRRRWMSQRWNWKCLLWKNDTKGGKRINIIFLESLKCSMRELFIGTNP